jgi:hypothetical protein
VVEGEAFIKRSELVYTDSLGLERYIDPLFDAKIGRMQEAGAKAAALPAPGVLDTSARVPAPTRTDASPSLIAADAEGRVILSEADVDRIARRVVDILEKH